MLTLYLKELEQNSLNKNCSFRHAEQEYIKQFEIQHARARPARAFALQLATERGCFVLAVVEEPYVLEACGKTY